MPQEIEKAKPLHSVKSKKVVIGFTPPLFSSPETQMIFVC